MYQKSAQLNCIKAKDGCPNKARPESNYCEQCWKKIREENCPYTIRIKPSLFLRRKTYAILHRHCGQAMERIEFVAKSHRDKAPYRVNGARCTGCGLEYAISFAPTPWEY